MTLVLNHYLKLMTVYDVCDVDRSVMWLCHRVEVTCCVVMYALIRFTG